MLFGLIRRFLVHAEQNPGGLSNFLFCKGVKWKGSKQWVRAGAEKLGSAADHPYLKREEGPTKLTSQLQDLGHQASNNTTMSMSPLITAAIRSSSAPY